MLTYFHRLTENIIYSFIIKIFPFSELNVKKSTKVSISSYDLLFFLFSVNMGFAIKIGTKPSDISLNPRRSEFLETCPSVTYQLSSVRMLRMFNGYQLVISNFSRVCGIHLPKIHLEKNNGAFFFSFCFDFEQS